MSDTTNTIFIIIRYRVTNSVCTENLDWVNLTSVIDVRHSLCSSEIQIGTYAVEHFKNMLDDELKKLEEKGTKRRIISEVIEKIKIERAISGHSAFNYFLEVHREDENYNSYEDREVTIEENVKYEVNPFQNEVENSIEYKIS